MDVRSISSNSPNETPWSEEPDLRASGGAGGAASSSSQEPTRGSEGAGGALGAPSKVPLRASFDCTTEVVSAAASCGDAVSTKRPMKMLAGAVAAEAAVACLVKRFSTK